MDNSYSLQGERRYQSIFEHSTVSLWEEDISLLRSRVNGLVSRGITDLRSYLVEHPEFVREAVRSIQVIDVNKATLRLYEAERKEQLLGPLKIALDEQAVESFREMIIALVEGRREIETESTAQSLRGKKLSLITKSYLPAETDAYPYMLVNVIDITDRKLADAQVRRLTKRIEFILGATKTGLDIIDVEYNLRYVDPEWQKMYGDPTGRKCYEYFAGTKDSCPGCGLPRAFRTKTAVITEEVLPREGNRPIQVTTIPYQDENGEWLAAEVNVDISERKRAEESNLRLATLVESSDDAIVGLDWDRRITVWNKGAERIYGYIADEIVGQPTSLLIPPALEGEAAFIRERLSRGERVEHFETIRRRKDGALINVSLTLSAIRDANGKVIGMASVARDVTAEKAMQAQILRAQKLESLATLAAGIAHQFNNINTVIRGYLDLLLREPSLQGRLAAYVREADKAIQRAIEITDGLLVLTGSSTTRGDSVHLDYLVRSILQHIEERIAKGNVSVKLELPETAPVLADEARLRFVVSSLLTNALDAVVDAPVRNLTVRTGSDSESVFLEVGDTGCGIATEDLSRIFSPFFTTKGEWARAGSSQTRLKGIGLSLAICHATVSEYGGKIDVHSVLETGSTFRLSLPAAPGAGLDPCP